MHCGFCLALFFFVFVWLFCACLSHFTTFLPPPRPIHITIHEHQTLLPIDKKQKGKENERSSEETNGLAHRRFEVERLYVLPVLLEEGNEEVDAEHDIP